MVFIVESGSTKADWILLDASANEVGRWSVKGLNPYFHDSDEVERTLRAEAAIMGHAPSIEKVFSNLFDKISSSEVASCLLFKYSFIMFII